MNQDDIPKSTSDIDTSERNSSSHNTSQNAEEFAIGGSNVDSDGLKLKISCLKKSVNNEMDGCKSIMNQPTAQDVNRYERDFEQSEEQNEDQKKTMEIGNYSMQLQGKEKAELRDNLSKTLPPEQTSEDKTSQEEPLPSRHSLEISGLQEENNPENIESPVESSVVTEPASQKATKEIVENSFSLEQKQGHFSSLETNKPVESLKKTYKLNNNIGSVNPHEPHDPLIRMDNLPNVSPDSGIISLDESTVGNESPNPVTAMDGIPDAHQCQQPSNVQNHAVSTDISRNSVDAEKHVVSSSVRITISRPESGQDVTHKQSEKSENCEDIIVRELDIETNKEKFSVHMPANPHSLSRQVSSISREASGAIDSSSLISQSGNTNTPGVIVSSPHKISQTSGRKKCGRSPKQTKTLLLKHKKSTLYSGVYTSKDPDKNSGEESATHLSSSSEKTSSGLNSAATIKDIQTSGNPSISMSSENEWTVEGKISTNSGISVKATSNDIATVHSLSENANSMLGKDVSVRNENSDSKGSEKGFSSKDTLEIQLSSARKETESNNPKIITLVSLDKIVDVSRPVKKKGRPKGSVNKPPVHVPFRRTVRQATAARTESDITVSTNSRLSNAKEKSTNINKRISEQTVNSQRRGQSELKHLVKGNTKGGKLGLKGTKVKGVKKSTEPTINRPRGRPRKNTLSNGSKNLRNDKTAVVETPASKSCELSEGAIRSQDLVSSPVKRGIIIRTKRNRGRKRFFTQRKKRSVPVEMDKFKSSDRKVQLSLSAKSLDPQRKGNGSNGKKSQASGKHSPNALIVKKGPEVVENKEGEIQNKSIFQDNDLDALLKSVHSSIHSQFTQEEDVTEVTPPLSFDNPFRVAQSPVFPQMVHTDVPKIVKPKPKKPKLHVMMRQHKRKKRRKLPVGKPAPSVPASVQPPTKLSVFTTVLPQRRFTKFTSCPPQKSTTGMFDTTASQKRLSFFSSRVQPSKILALGRLNVFQSGTGVDSQYRMTDVESSEGLDKKGKKRHRLLYRKSKHKNIIDPALAADLDTLLNGIGNLTIAENGEGNYIRVRPGEMPLPSIFRVIKIDLNRKLKEKVTLTESMTVDKSKVCKARKRSPSPHDQPPTAFRRVGKTGKKLNPADQPSDQIESSCISDCSDQCLPPKKRHRLVNLESSQQTPGSTSVSPSTSSEHREELAVTVKKRGRKSRKQNQDKGGDLNKHILASKFLSQQLTIDTTSSYSTGPSSLTTPSPSSCPSRLSTRSSTLHSLSSPSPSGAAIGVNSGNRRLSARRSYHQLECPMHAMSSTTEDKAACAECQLLQQSASPGTFRSRRNSGSVLSNYRGNHGISSGELSPVIRTSQVPGEKGPMRSTRKRRKSSNFSGYESDSSPPRLEKTSALSPGIQVDCDVFSDPPEITSSPVNKDGCPHSPNRLTNQDQNWLGGQSSPGSTRSGQQLSSPKKLSLRPSSLHQSPLSKLHCNSTSGWSPWASVSRAVSLSEFEPLPLEHCSKRKLVEEISSILDNDSSDELESHEEEKISIDHCSTQSLSGQPLRKRYQRVGLFSDFYKDDEPKKRLENMVRCRDKLVYFPEEHEYGLMPQPIHIGQHYMRLLQDFQLPYDIWWQHSHQQLPKKQEPKVKFRNIRTNVYSDNKVSNRKVEIPLCSCNSSTNDTKGCLDDCLNRMIYTECSPSTCPLGENCGNQRIQKHDWAPGLEKFTTADRGYGVKTTQPIKTGQFILEYLGEVISETELRRRLMEEYSDERHHYALHLDSGSVIDGYRMGNVGRYVNHSCQPNCEMQKWNVNGLYRMVLFALRDIHSGEELSYDYNFDPFNQETQQECRCGSLECRGFIGGKTQRNCLGNGRIEKSDDCKDKRKNKLMNKKTKDKNQSTEYVQVQPLAKPMSLKERCYARKHRTFLVRNVDKVRNQRHPNLEYHIITKEELNPLESAGLCSLPPDLMLAHLNERSVKTRLAAFAKDNPEMARKHQLAQVFDKILTELLALKDEDGDSLVTALMTLPSRKKQPQYYQVVRKPIDLSMIKQRVKMGYYNHLNAFHNDLMLLFSNVELYCGPKSDLGQIILKLRRIFNCVKQEVAEEIDELLGPSTTKTCLDHELDRREQALCKGKEEPEEDIIRCICGVTRDEGLMLQCEKCLRWQHCDCVQASGKEEHYLCDRCEPRYYDPEIPLRPSPADALPDCTYYMTVVKDDLQYAIGDCVYVMRDCKRTASGTPLRSSHRLMASANPDKLDIFRLEQLWKDPKGERFASGTPYLRPQETFHEPTRKFYHNELFRTPNFEIIPMDLVMGKCVVLDPNTYCKGRPKGIKEQDVYICEYRVDKTAHLFYKIQKIWYPINTGKFCFDWFDARLTLKRTFSPHEVPEEYKRKAERNMACKQEGSAPVKTEQKQEPKKALLSSSKGQGLLSEKVKVDESLKHDLKLKAEVKVNVKKGGHVAVLGQKLCQTKLEENKRMLHKLKEEKLKEKKHHLDRIMRKLLNSIPGKQKIDLTYLLDDGKRIRKKLIK